MSQAQYNESIRKLLADLAGLNPQLGPIELCCMWFDDLYSPASKAPAGYSAETWEQGQREWKSCFSEVERRILDRFHGLFAMEVDALPVTGEWQQDAGWQRVSAAARHALNQLGGLPG